MFSKPFALVLALFGLALAAPAQIGSMRPTLGVTLHPEGIVIASVDEGSLAAAAGLRAGDYLTHWDSRPIPSVEAVIAARDAARAGSQVTLRVLRGAASEELPLAIPEPIPAGGLMLGVNVGSGLFVASVLDDSAAKRAGVEPGDIIESLGGRPVADLPALRAMLAAVRWGQSREMVVNRGGRTVSLQVTFTAPEGMEAPFAPMPPAPPEGLGPERMPRWTRSLLDLDEVKKEIDAAVGELKALDDQRLAGVIERLERQSERLQGLAGTMGRIRVFGQRLRDDIEDLQDLRAIPFPGNLDLTEIQRRMEALMERHGDDLDAIRRALREEFPGMDILIDKDGRGPLHLKVEVEEKEAAPAPLERREAPAPVPQERGEKDAPAAPTEKN